MGELDISINDVQVGLSQALEQMGSILVMRRMLAQRRGEVTLELVRVVQERLRRGHCMVAELDGWMHKTRASMNRINVQLQM